ncbi:MAG TPA: AAA family ATPase [Prolixibacteraceae bacterium]
MDRLKQIAENRLQSIQTDFTRFLTEDIDWDARMIGISGARGAGKTTLMLQYLKTRLPANTEALYASLDDIYFAENPLIYLAEEFYKKGGEYLFLDEVHKYPDWSRELKNIYDNLPGLKIVFTSSSALDIYKGAFDLSRRALVYNLPGLSFREFIELKYRISLPSYSLEQILFENKTIVSEILNKIKPLRFFEEYLKFGYYPFFIESERNYYDKLTNILNLVLESDLPTIFKIDYYSVMKIKKMLSVLSRIVPYKPNIEKLALQADTTRDTLLKFLFYLEKAGVVKWLSKDIFGINYLNKPDKLYLNNTNLMYALSNEKPDTGNLRETFILNQLFVKHSVSYPETGDFLVDGKYLVEVGGPSKKSKQIAGLENAFIAVDDIEFPDGRKIPLWLFGFLY